MANWVDVFSLILTLTVVAAAIYAAFIIKNAIQKGVQSTKKTLENKGLTLSETGLNVKTSRRFNREDYVDATQRGLVMAAGAASFGKSKFSNDGTPNESVGGSSKKSLGSVKMSRSISSGSNGTQGESSVDVEERKRKRDILKRVAARKNSS